MKATEILKEEHDIILHVLDVIDAMAGKIRAGERVDAGHLEKIVDFIVNFADRCHHSKEEGILFPAMVKAGFPAKEGPIAVMLHEHETGRSHVRKMKEALGRAAVEGPGALKDFAREAAGYTALLRNHIAKENGVLFRMADEHIVQPDQDALFRAFEKVEREEIGEGVHERYHGMAHDLAERYLG